MGEQFEIRVTQTIAPPMGPAAGFAWMVLRTGKAVQCGWAGEYLQAELDAAHAVRGWDAARIAGSL